MKFLKPVFLFACVILLMECQNDDDPIICCPPVPTVSVYLHGSVLDTDSSGIAEARILVCKATDKCDSSTDLLPEKIFSGFYGKYDLILRKGLPHQKKDTTLVKVRLKLKGHINYISPKPEKLKIYYNRDVPRDSIHVNFTVEDTTKK